MRASFSRVRCIADSALGKAHVVLAALLAFSCAATLKSERAAFRLRSGGGAPRVALPTPARWLPLDRETPRYIEEQADGSVRRVERGLRLVEHPDGAIDAASDLLPADGQLGELGLPRRFGGGFLFYVTGGDTTALFRTRQFTDPLVPLVKLPFEAADLVAGFDRLYAVSARTRALVGIDPSNGNLLGTGSVPEAPAYGGIAFSDGWLGAVEVDLRGILITFDAGASWHPLGMPPAVPGSLREHAVSEHNGRIVLGTTRGAFALDASGGLVRADSVSEETEASDDDTAPSEASDVTDSSAPKRLGGRPLELAVLRGYPDSPTTAVVLSNGALARVSLTDGRVVDSREDLAPRAARCQATLLGDGIGFICGEVLGPTTVYAYRPPLDVARVLFFASPRHVASSGNGALVVRGGCDPAAPQFPATYCILSRAGTLREVRVAGDTGLERVAARSDGSVAILVPPRRKKLGVLTLVTNDGKSTRVDLSLGDVSEEARNILEQGMWLDGMVETETGVLSGWVVGSEPFVGVRVAFDGKVTTGVPQSSVERASFHGSLGFFTDGRASARESTDGGRTWSDVQVPDANLGDPAPDRERGCTPVGCSLGPWLRVGWGKGRGSSDLVAARDPPKAALGPQRFVTWSLSCLPTGETEGASDVAQAARKSPARRVPESSAAPAAPGAFAALETSAWRPFLGMAAPERDTDELGFDFGTEDQVVELRGYAWGPRGAPWDQTGTWLVRAVDRFAVKHAIWSTAPSRSPWIDAGAAAEVFGSEPTHRVSNEWNGILDPVDDAGIVIQRTGTQVSLSAVEKGRAITTIGNADEYSLDRPSGAVKVLGKFYLGVIPGPRAFQILGVDGGTLSIAGSYPRLGDDSFTRVVRTERGDALGIWVIAAGHQGTRSGGDTWFVYPVDVTTGTLSTPLVVPAEDLSHAPPPCGAESDGWVLVHEVSRSITKLDFDNVIETPSVEHLEARLVAGPQGICLDALAGQVEGDPPKDLKPHGSITAPAHAAAFALTDRATDRRWGFRCAP